MQAILVFRDRPGLKCPEYVRYCYTMACFLLRRYLEDKYKSNAIVNDKYLNIFNVLQGLDPILVEIQNGYDKFYSCVPFMQKLVEEMNNVHL